jgi:hypothetical protein
MNKTIKRNLITKQHLLKIVLTAGTHWLLPRMITNIIIGPSITIIMKTITIIESMIERAVRIDIITGDLLLPL